MAASDFSRGYPRQGQWVYVNGRVGVNTGAVTLSGGALFRIALLDKTGFKTEKYEAVPVNGLMPVLTRDAIPAARLATMDPKWTPKA